MGALAAIIALNLYLFVLYKKGPWRLARLRSQHPLISGAAIVVGGFMVPFLLSLTVLFGVDFVLSSVIPDFYKLNNGLHSAAMPILQINAGVTLVVGISFKVLWVFDDKRSLSKEEKIKVPSHN